MIYSMCATRQNLAEVAHQLPRGTSRHSNARLDALLGSGQFARVKAIPSDEANEFVAGFDLHSLNEKAGDRLRLGQPGFGRALGHHPISGRAAE